MQTCWEIIYIFKKLHTQEFHSAGKIQKMLQWPDKWSQTKASARIDCAHPLSQICPLFWGCWWKTFFASKCFLLVFLWHNKICWRAKIHSLKSRRAFFSSLRSILASIYSAAFQAEHYDVKTLCSQNKTMLPFAPERTETFSARAGAPFFCIYRDSPAKMSCETFSSGDKEHWTGVGSYHPDPEKSCKSQRGGRGGVGSAALH